MKSNKDSLDIKEYLEKTQSFFVSEGIADILNEEIEKDKLSGFTVVIENQQIKINKEIYSFIKNNNIKFEVDLLSEEIKVFFGTNKINCIFYCYENEILRVMNSNFSFKLYKVDNQNSLYSAKIILN